MTTAPWSPTQIPDLSGRTAVVTGPTRGGLGFHTALELARRGATVVLAGRTPAALAEATRAIAGEVPAASLHTLVVDLADLDSVRAAADRATTFGPVHLLINNAGVMAVPYERTTDGLERQLATNHFGPFLLTGLLLPQLIASGDGRVVTVSSVMHHRAAQAPLGDPRRQHGRYRKWVAYSQSKLANLLFTFELDRRLARAGAPVIAVAAHPGFSSTRLVDNSRAPLPTAVILDAAVRGVAQSPRMGAWPIVMAATADIPGSTFCGPGGPRELKGRPRIVEAAGLARDEEVQRMLWELSERTVGLAYP